MSFSSIATANSNSQTDNSCVQIMQSYQRLRTALQSCNLTAAQRAYNQLQHNSDNSLSLNTPSESTVANLLQNLGSALQSRNLAAAQQTFAQLQRK